MSLSVAEWPTVELGDHVDLLTGFPFKSKEFTDDPDDVPLIRGDNVAQGFLRWENAKRWDATQYGDFAKFHLREGDVVLAMDRPWISAGLKYGWIAKRDSPALLVQRVARMRGENGLETDYLRYVIGSPAFTDHVLSIITGVNVPHISGRDIKTFKFRLPPLPTQQRIASILSAYDDLIENNTRRIAILEEMARRLYEEWFVHFRFPGYETAEFDGDLPKGWSNSTIGEKFSVVLGGTPSRKKLEYWTDGTVPWINSGRVNDLRILQPSELITERALAKSAAKLMPKGTVVLAITGATLGQVSVLMEPMSANQSVVGLWDHTGERNEYLYRMVSHEIGSIISRASGGAQQHINKEIVKQTAYTEPTNDVRKKFNQTAIPIGLQVEVLIRKNANLRAQRDLLLPKLVSGEIDVSAAEAELEAAE